MLPPSPLDRPVRIALFRDSCQTAAPPFNTSPLGSTVQGHWGEYFIADNLNRLAYSGPEAGIGIKSHFLQNSTPSEDDRCDMTADRFSAVNYLRPTHVVGQPRRPFERISIEVTCLIDQFTQHLGIDNDAWKKGSCVSHVAAELHVVMPDRGEVLKREIAKRTVYGRDDAADYHNLLPGGTTRRFTLSTTQAYPVLAPLPVSFGFWFTHSVRANKMKMESIVELRAKITSVKVCSLRAV